MSIDWTTVITVIVSGSGGGLLGVIINSRTADRANQRQLQQNAKLEAQAKEVALLSAKTDLRRAVDEAAQLQLERHRLEFDRLAKRIDAEIAAREEVLQRNDELVAELRALSAEHASVLEQLAATKTALALAEAEIDRKETVIVSLQEQVAELEKVVEDLQARLAECTGATGSSSN